MKSRPTVLALALALTLLLAGGCARALTGGLNLVEQAGLQETVQIEVLEFARWAPGESE